MSATLSGSITPGGPPVTVTTSTPGETVELTFEGTAGQRVFAQFTNNTINASCCNEARAYIRNPDGSSLPLGTQVDVSPYGGVYFYNNSLIDTVTLPTAGTYTLVIVPRSTQTGSVTVTLYDVPADATAAVTPSSGAGSAVALASTMPGQNLTVTFTGAAGQRVFAQFTNNTINANCCNQSRAYILKPDGATLPLGTQVDVSPYGGVYFYNNSLIDTVTLPTAGTYTLVADPQRAQTGSATFTLYDVPMDPTAAVTPSPGAGSAVALATTTPGQNLSVTFAGTAGQRIFAQFTNNTINANCCNQSRAYILKPDGATLPLGTQVDVSPYGGVYFYNNSLIDTVTLPTAGTYTLVADPQRAQTGSATFTLYDVPPDPSVPIAIGGSSQTLATTTPGQNLALTFTGSAGQSISAQFTNNTINPSCCNQARAYLLKPDGATLPLGTQSDASPYGGVYFYSGSGIDPVTLPVSGQYTLVADPQRAQTGAATFTLAAGGAWQPPEQTYGVLCEVLGRGSLAQAPCGLISDPVNTLTGAFTYAETDFSLAGTGVALQLTRTYTSADSASTRFGQGWTDNYQASLAAQPSGDVIAKSDEGQRLTFASLGGGAFDGGPGARATLTAVAGGYRLTTSDQVVYEFDSAGKLRSKKDRNGQGVTLAYDGSGRLATVTDAAGKTATFSYNASSLVTGLSLSDGRSVSYGYTSGRLTTFTDVRGKTWTYGYDAGGRLATIVDPLTHTQVSNVYDQTTGRVTSQTDATNKTTTFAWDPATQTATVTDPNNHLWKDVYASNVLVKRIDATNNTTEFGFDADLNGTSVKSPAIETTTMSYDAAGNLLTATAPASLGSATKTFVYNANNDPTSVTDARNKVTSYTYTSAGNVETVTQDGLLVASYTYDAQGRVLTATDGNNKTTSYTYDAAGNVTSLTQPDPDGPGPLGQPKTTYTYNSQGNVLTRVDPKGNVVGCGCAAQYTTTSTYNAAGKLLTESDPLGHVTANVYDDSGRLTSATDANNHTTSYTYDHSNRVLTETGHDPDGAGPLAAPVTSYTYDSAGNKLTETDARANTTTFGYDNANRLISVTGPDPDGAGPLTAPLTTHAYDANGNLASTVEPRGNVSGANPNDYKTTYGYDAAGRLKTTTDPLGNVTTNAYDTVGNLQSVTDANNRVTSYTHDAAGRLITVTAPDPDGTGPLLAPVTTYTYDAVGNQLTRTDAKNHVTTTSYDALNRVASVASPDPDGAGSQTPSLTTKSYDLNGNLLTVTDANGNGTGTAGDGTTTYGYDRANRLTSINYSDTTPDVTFTLDNVGNRLTMADGSGTETRSYDNLDRLLTVARAANTFSYVYDAAGNVTRRTYPDGTIVDHTYDPLNRLASLTSGGRTTTYSFDAASNPTTTTLPSENGYIETRTYDRAGRLTAVKSQKAATVLADITYTRDGVGNPLTETRTGTAPITKTFTYDNLHRITGVCFQTGSCPGATDPFIRWTYDGVGNRLSEQRPTSTTNYSYDNMDRLLTAGSTPYTYDRNGNQLSAGSTTLTYDLANRLKTAAQGSTTTTYTYNGDGVRLQASTGSQANKKTNFLWDVNNPLPQLALERNGSDALLRRYINGHRPLSMWTSSTSGSYYHYDPLGSVRDVSSNTGATQLTYDYEPYGTIRTQTGSSPTNLLKFTGEYHDPTGLYHLRARQYDPSNGRFVGVDPLEMPTTSPHVARYVYAANRPTVFTDPSGMTFIPSDEGMSSARDAVSTIDVGLAKTISFVPSNRRAGINRTTQSVAPWLIPCTFTGVGPMRIKNTLTGFGTTSCASKLAIVTVRVCIEHRVSVVFSLGRYDPNAVCGPSHQGLGGALAGVTTPCKPAVLRRSYRLKLELSYREVGAEPLDVEARNDYVRHRCIA